MSIIKKVLVAITVFGCTVATPASASERSDGLREGVKSIDTRTQAIRGMEKRASAEAKVATEKVLREVDRYREMLERRITVVELISPLEHADERVLGQMEAALAKTDRALTVVEKWYGVK
jgi:hypothetical protein